MSFLPGKPGPGRPASPFSPIKMHIMDRNIFDHLFDNIPARPGKPGAPSRKENRISLINISYVYLPNPFEPGRPGAPSRPGIPMLNRNCFSSHS